MHEILSSFGIDKLNPGTWARDSLKGGGPKVDSFSPIDNQLIASVTSTTKEQYDQVINEATEVFAEWRKVPAPERGLLVREIGEALRAHKHDLGKLITIEMGKILAEGEGEVQEAIDIADFAVGLSRQLYGKTMHSERPAHRMYEQWHPLGIVGTITAFNFPVAVWAWNSMIAAVCGDVVLWKPSELTPIVSLATHKICHEVAKRRGFSGLFTLIQGDASVGAMMVNDKRVPLISATGSCRMGRVVSEAVGKRLGKVILELGGNNAVIVLNDADLNLVVPSTVFGSVGTAGQRCTTSRRILAERPIEEQLTQRLVKAYQQIRIGNPLDPKTLMGPLINKSAVESYLKAVETAKAQGGKVLYGGEVVKGMPSELYVKPTLIKATSKMEIVKEETFAPIAYIIPGNSLDELVVMNNQVAQGLSSSIFTRNVLAAERFLSVEGSDCGIANVNIGTSGAEIGGAFGGEKDTGGGREAGSDSWKQYMRRQTNTINYSSELPLAQGIKFDL